MQNKIKIITLIEYSPITGVKYGETEIVLKELELLYKSEQIKQKTEKAKNNTYLKQR